MYYDQMSKKVLFKSSCLLLTHTQNLDDMIIWVLLTFFSQIQIFSLSFLF